MEVCLSPWKEFSSYLRSFQGWNFWISCVCITFNYLKTNVFINIKEYSNIIFISIFYNYAVAGIENWLSGKLQKNLLLLNSKISSNVYFISPITDSNFFCWEFILRRPRKKILGCLLLKPLWDFENPLKGFFLP